jgi:hypothetical protein
MTDIIMIIDQQQARPRHNRMVVTVEKGDIEWGERPPVDSLVEQAAKPDDEGKPNGHIKSLEGRRITPRSVEVEFFLEDEKDWSWNKLKISDKWGTLHQTTNCFVVGSPPKKPDGTPQDPPANCKQTLPL